MLKNAENANIKEWYLNAFPTDELGCELNDVLFIELFTALDKDVYELLGVHDSLIRERVFGELSEIMKVDYDYIYNKWLAGE